VLDTANLVFAQDDMIKCMGYKKHLNKLVPPNFKELIKYQKEH
jgi:hypothetical protein